MYNVDGIIYRIFAVGGIIFLLFVGCFFIVKPWTIKSEKEKNKRRKKILEMITLTVGLIWAVCTICFYSYKSFNPKIESYTGAFVREYRDSTVAPPLPFTSAYVFDGYKGKDRRFYIDSSSKKAIYPEDFSEGKMYIIYYEKDTKIIVGVEEVD